MHCIFWLTHCIFWLMHCIFWLMHCIFWLMHCRFAPNQGRATLCSLYVAAYMALGFAVLPGVLMYSSYMGELTVWIVYPISAAATSLSTHPTTSWKVGPIAPPTPNAAGQPHSSQPLWLSHASNGPGGYVDRIPPQRSATWWASFQHTEGGLGFSALSYFTETL